MIQDQPFSHLQRGTFVVVFSSLKPKQLPIIPGSCGRRNIPSLRNCPDNELCSIRVSTNLGICSHFVEGTHIAGFLPPLPLTIPLNLREHVWFVHHRFATPSEPCQFNWLLIKPPKPHRICKNCTYADDAGVYTASAVLPGSGVCLGPDCL